MSLPPGDETSKAKLPVWRTIGDAYATAFNNIDSLFALAIVPIVLSVVVWVGSIAVLGAPFPQGDQQTAYQGWSWLFTVCQIVISTVFGVAWIRFVLFGRRDSAAPFQFRLGRREGKFLLYILILTVPFVVVQFVGLGVFMALTLTMENPSALIGAAIFILLFSLAILVAMFIVYVRCVFVFPAIAVDADMGLRAAWGKSRGVAWRLFGIVLFAFLPFTLLISLIMWSFQTLDAGSAELTFTYVLGSAQQVVAYLGAAVTYGVVALAFRRVTGWRPAATEGDPGGVC